MRWLVALLVLLGAQAHDLARAIDEPAQKAAPTLSLAPSSGPSGSTVKASGTGYCGSVILRWDDKAQLNSGGSDEHGNISITFTVPRDAAPGQHAVTSTSECGGTKASFKVVEVSGAQQAPRKPPSSASENPPSSVPENPPSSVPEKPPSSVPEKPPLSVPEKPPLSVPEKPPLSVPEKPPLSAPEKPPSSAPADYKDSTLAQYEDIVKHELESGVILYNPPGQMRVGVAYRVEVRIAREESDDLAKGLQGKADPRVEELLVGTTMRAKLEGSAFNIVLIGSDVQELAAKGFREWRWDVTPIASGSHPLSFVVSVLHEKYSNPIEEKVFERRIDVTVNPGYSLSKWLSNNWEKLVAASVGMIGVIEGYRRLRLRRTDDRSGDIAPDRVEG